MQNKRKSKYSLKKKLDYIVHSFFKKHFHSYLFQTSEIVILEDTHSLAPYSWCMKIRNFALLTFQFHLLPFTCNPNCVFSYWNFIFMIYIHIIYMYLSWIVLVWALHDIHKFDLHPIHLTFKLVFLLNSNWHNKFTIFFFKICTQVMCIKIWIII